MPPSVQKGQLSEGAPGTGRPLNVNSGPHLAEPFEVRKQDMGPKPLSQTHFRICAGLAGPGLCILNKDCAEFGDQSHFLRSATELPQREMRYIECLCCFLHIPLTGPHLIQPWLHF